MEIRPIYPYAALLLESNNERYVVISDLHIGFEEQYIKKGISIDTEYIHEIGNELRSLADIYKPYAFIILGDLKDSVAKISKREWILIPEFLEEIRKISKVIIVPGNHDNNIDRLVPNDIIITSTQGFIIDRTLLIHGHTIPKNMNIKRIIMGHLHPRIAIEDHLLNGERVWIFLRIDKGILDPSTTGTMEIAIMPSYNRYLTSKNKHSNSIVPLLRRVSEQIDDCIIITLDGSIIGDKDMLKYILL